MKSKKIKKSAYSLVELTVAMLILGVAVIPLIATISNDTKNSVVIANNEFAMQKARFILDTMLDSVRFDDLQPGSPAILQGKSLESFYDSMFPKPTMGRGRCSGYIIDDKGQTFLATLRVQNFPNGRINFQFLKTPDSLFPEYYNGINQPPWWYARNEELNSRRPSFAYYSYYNDASNGNRWGGAKPDSYDNLKFYGRRFPVLLKSLILTIQWNDKNKHKPEERGFRSFTLITNKARLDK